MATSLVGRSALVTGATRGIGLAIAQSLLRAGASVTITGRDPQRLSTAVRTLTPFGAVRGVRADVGDTSHSRETMRTLGDVLDIVVANAGIYPAAPLGEIDDAALDEMLTVNVKGTINTVQSALPLLRESRHGRVVVISSITGNSTGLPGWSHYAVSKAAQVGFVRTAALELAPHRITVNAILAGNTRTEGLEALGDEYLARMTRAIPLGRLAEPQDIANACVFLASDEAAFITGQTITVDGGQVLPEALSG